ncbi:MAG: hypothetical protein WDO74_12260 [Pseudomonadota bacterium]
MNTFQRIASVALLGAAVLAPTVNAHAGNFDGPLNFGGRVAAFDTRTYKLVLEGDERTTIKVIGDGDTTLACTLKDRNGRVIASDMGDNCYIRVNVYDTTGFYLTIGNVGLVYNDFVVRSN